MLVENEVPQRKDADCQTSPPGEVLQNNVEKPLYPLDECLPKEMSPEQSINTSSPDSTDFVGDTLQVINTARRQIQNIQRDTLILHNLRIPKKQPFSDDKAMWSETGYKPKNTVPKDFTSFAELQKEIVPVNPGPRLTDVGQLESSGNKDRTNCPPNTPEVNIQYVDKVDVQNVSRQEIVNYDLKEDPRTTNENAGSKNVQSQAIVAKGRHDKLTVKDVTLSPKRFTQNVCGCNQSQGEKTQDQRQTIEKNVVKKRIKEVNKTFENIPKSQSTSSKTKSDAETNTEIGIRFRNTPNTAIISVKTQETSTRLSEKVENKECCLRKTLQIQAMPSIKIQPKFTIQKGPKVHIPPSSTLAAAFMKRKNVELKEIFHPSVNYVYMERDNTQFDRHNVNEKEEAMKTGHSSIDDSQNIPNSLKDNTKKDITVHDKLNNLAKTLSSKLDKDDKKKNKNNEKLSHTLKTLSDNISKLFDNYLEAVPQNLKRLSPRMNMIASLLLEELQSPHSLTDDYCCKLIDSMHYLIQDLEKEYEMRVCQKNTLQPPQHCAIIATNDVTNQTELRRPLQKPVVHSENYQQQTSKKQQRNSVQSRTKTNVKKNYVQPSTGLLDSHKKSETFVRKSIQKKPVTSLRQQETLSNVKNILQKRENVCRTSRTEFSNRNPLLQSNYLKPIESGLNFANTGAKPKTNRHVTQNNNKPEGNFELKQWQNERMKNIQEIHKKLLMTELTLTRPEKFNKAKEIDIDIPSDSSSAMEFVKKYIQTSDHVLEDSFIGHTTPIADSYDGGNIAEETSAQMNKDIEETISRQESEKVSEIEDETSGSEAVEADGADNGMEAEYAEDWEVDEDDANSSKTSAEEIQIEESHLSNIVEEKEEAPSMDDKVITPAVSDINNIKESLHDLVGSTEILPEVEITSVHNPKQREMNTEEMNSSNISVKSNNLMTGIHQENVSKVNNVSKGCNTSTKKSFCDGIDQIPLKLSLFGFENNKKSVKNYPEKSNSKIMKLNTEQISDLSVPNLNLDTSPIENLIQVSVPKTNRQENIVEINSSRTNQSINVVVHVGNDSDLNKTYDKKEPVTKTNQENTSSSDEVIKYVLANNSSTSANEGGIKNADENLNIDELISSNLKKYVIQPTVNEMFEKFNQFKTNTTIDREGLQNKQESPEEAKNIGHRMNSKQSETMLNLIKPNVILQSSNEFWHSIQDFPTSQDKVTQSEKITQDFSVQTDHEKLTIQTQVTESLASDSNNKKSHDDMTDFVNFSQKINVSKKYVSSSQTKTSDSDTRLSSSSSSSTAVPYSLRSLKWSLSSLFNSDAPLSEGEIILSTSSSGAHSLGEVRSTEYTYLNVPKTKHYDTLSLGEIKTKPQRKPCKRSTGTSTPELTYSVSKERLKSIPKYINPQPKKENDVQVEKKTISNSCIDNETEKPDTSNVDSVLLQPTNYTDSSLKRKPQNKIITKTFNELASDILQELINESSVMDDQVTSNEIIANIVKLNKNTNMKDKEIINEINLVCSENVMTDKNKESVEHRIESSNEIIVVTNEQVKKQVRIDKPHKSKVDLLKTLSNSKSTFEKQKERVEPTTNQLVQTFSHVNKKKNVTLNDRLVMKLENQKPNLEVFIEESHSEPSSVSLCGTSITSVSSDDLPGVCEFDLTLGSHSGSERTGSKHGDLLCTSSSDS